ncbi:hypothetical protein H4S04_001025 [Coemansia sp. S16]|nr:hypothetical protein H4S04_001025 [Coemansia sp. S16]
MKSFIILVLSLFALVSAYPIAQDQYLTEVDKCDEYQESMSTTEAYTSIPNIFEVDELILNSLGLIDEDQSIEQNDESAVANDIDTENYAPFDGWNFQDIRKLKLQFYQDEWDEQNEERNEMLEQANTKSEYYHWLEGKRREIEEEDLKIALTVKANINEFVFWVKQMMPTLREIEIEYDIDELEHDPGNDFFDTLLEPLLRLAPRIVH